MTYKNIYEYFKGDDRLLQFFHPNSSPDSIEEAVLEIYDIMLDYAKSEKCNFVSNEIGYVFYSKNRLISFCVKPEKRTKSNLKDFGDFIKKTVGKHFNCYLFLNNSRAINFLMRMGMKVNKVDNSIILLTI